MKNSTRIIKVRNIDHIIAENNSLKQKKDNLQQGMENKNKDIIELKAQVEDLNEQIVKKGQEINQVVATLRTSKSKM